MNKIKLTLEDLGYEVYFENGRNNLGFSEFTVARVVAEYREAYRVISKNDEYLAKITGKQMYTATKRDDYPAVGDWVVINELPNGKAVIRGILPRKSVLKKKYSDKQENQIIASNIDIALITESMDRDYNLNRLERFLVIAKEGRINPVIILNKIDLIPAGDLKFRIDEINKRFTDIEIITTSILTEHGVRELEKFIIPSKTYCFLGSSGVGKSSLINKLLRKDEIKTREISIASERGRHTTTTREMYFIENGGLLIDNPGTREVGIAGSYNGIENVFDEVSIMSQKCKFSDCSHTNEPGCAVIKAVNESILDEDNYDNYIKLKKESEFYKLTDVEKREKDRKFGKFVKKALKELKN
jgi:ribosome biogenesis GTPase / thiamine phosphate phosphatase